MKGRPSTTKRDRVLIEEGGIMHSHQKAPKDEKELRTVHQPRKPGTGTPQNPPKPNVGRAPKEEK